MRGAARRGGAMRRSAAGKARAEVVPLIKDCRCARAPGRANAERVDSSGTAAHAAFPPAPASAEKSVVPSPSSTKYPRTVPGEDTHASMGSEAFNSVAKSSEGREMHRNRSSVNAGAGRAALARVGEARRRNMATRA